MTNLQKFSAVSIFQNENPVEYNQLYSLVREKGLRHGLRIEIARITSHYGEKSTIATKYGTTIDLIGEEWAVPVELYMQLATLANCNKSNPLLSVCLGYGDRTINVDRSASITTGTHCPTHNTISFDIKVHRQLQNAKEVMKKRFAHEMLHEFGRDEREVLQEENIFYEKTSAIVDPFINSIYSELESADNILESRINAVFEDCSDERRLLDRMYAECIQKGCPDLDGAMIDLINPIDNVLNVVGFL